MATLKIIGDKEIENIDISKSILEILVSHKIFINNPCNGKGICGKCKIKIINGKVSLFTSTEQKFLSEKEIKEGIRLACLTYLYGSATIEIIDKEKRGDVLVDSFTRDFVKDNMMNGLGIAVDIGTTTVVAELIDLSNGSAIANASMINPQKQYGLDVLTRITYENENGDEGIRNLKDAIIDGLNVLLHNLINKTKRKNDEIRKIVISANCTMMHMLLGIDARSIGRYPYKPAFVESKIVNARALGLDVGDETICICLPHVSSFIGADIVSGIYVCDLKKIKGNVLFIDIGTNAEIVLNANGRLISCSCAAGPALEGMNISQGMRAENGAIEDVVIDGDNVSVKTIGNEKPEGLCGSGILAVIKELIRNKIIKKNGAFIKKEDLEDGDFRINRIQIIDKKKEYVIDREAKVSITQSDIRQVQLAKGAILSGFVALLNKCNIDMVSLDKVLVAGQFGAHLPAESIVGVGILPKEIKDKISYVGNVSKAGAYITLMSKNALKEMDDLSKEVEYLELADTDDYEKIFVKSMEFPNE